MEEKIALVTGASRGIGSQIAKTLAKKNIFVVVNYSGSKENAEQTAEEIINAGGKAVVYGCDISDFYATEDMVKEIVKQYGRLDILINNAGITKDNLIMRMSEADFDRVIEVNLKGAFNTIHAAARQMIRQKSGKIVNIASVSGCWKCPFAAMNDKYDFRVTQTRTSGLPNQDRIQGARRRCIGNRLKQIRNRLTKICRCHWLFTV